MFPEMCIRDSCKKALVESDGDMDKAIDWLREKGLAQAAKKAGRIAAEGAVAKRKSCLQDSPPAAGRFGRHLSFRRSAILPGRAFCVIGNSNEISYYTKKRHWLSLPVSPIKTIIFIFSQLSRRRNAGRMCPLRSQKTTQFTLLPESPE